MVHAIPGVLLTVALSLLLAATAGASRRSRLGAEHEDFLAMLEAGRSKAAAAAAEGIARKAAEAMSAGPGFSSEPVDNLEIYAAAPLWAMLRFGSWDAILARAAPPGDRPIAVAFHHMARGVALARKRDYDGAAAGKRAFDAARGRVGSETRLGNDLALDVLNVAGFVLDGRMLEAKGDRDRALASWRAAAQSIEALADTPPPGWYHAPGEPLGGALLRAGRYQEAEKVFRDALEKDPDRPRLLFGLALALGAGHKDAEAEAVHERFRAAWRRADVPLKLEDL